MSNQASEERLLEMKLIELFAKCTSFGYSMSPSVTKEQFAEMLSDGKSLDHQEAAHEAMQLIHQHTEQAVEAEKSAIYKEFGVERHTVYRRSSSKSTIVLQKIASFGSEEINYSKCFHNQNSLLVIML